VKGASVARDSAWHQTNQISTKFTTISSPIVIMLQKQHKLVVLLAKRFNRKTVNLLTLFKSFSINY
jgi:hypothetical protein